MNNLLAACLNSLMRPGYYYPLSSKVTRIYPRHNLARIRYKRKPIDPYKNIPAEHRAFVKAGLSKIKEKSWGFRDDSD